MAIYRGTGGFSNVTGTAEIEYVTEKSVEIQNAVAEVEQLAAEITSNTSAAQAAADTAVAASNGVQGFATIASTKAAEAQVSATNAQTSANTATTQALAASTSATNAENSANAANTSALSAATSEFNAELSATTATTKALEASTSASNAASSASSASTSASTATTAATTATTKASEASASAAAAAQSAIDAAQFDPSSYYIKSETDTLLAAKQATLVSGTNIKTVNGASILGSGNITTPTTTVNNTLTSTSTTEALSAAQGKVLQDGKQATLVSGTNIKTVNSTSLLGSGNISISSGVQLATPSANQWVGLTIYTSTTNITVPTGATVMRAYAWGKGGDGGASSSGGGGGCAYGEIAVTAGQTVNLSISSGVATVGISGTTYLTANPASGATRGTASKHASVTNGGAYSGGAGATSASSPTGGASSGSMFGTGVDAYNAFRGGSSWTYNSLSNYGAGAGLGGYPVFIIYGGTGYTFGGRGLNSSAVLVDPLLDYFKPFSGNSLASGGSGGGGGSMFSNPSLGGFGAGGNETNASLFGGGAGSSASNAGYFGGGGAGRGAGEVGAGACIVVCWR